MSRSVLLLLLLLASAPARALEVAITFDDLPVGPANERYDRQAAALRRVVEILRREKVPGAYAFVTTPPGGGLSEHAHEGIRLWGDDGYSIGNHTASHRDPNLLSVKEFEAEVKSNEPFLRDVAEDMDWHWFRFPYIHQGLTEEQWLGFRGVLRAEGYVTAPVSVDFGDSAWLDAYARCRKSGKHARAEILRADFVKMAVRALRYSDDAAVKVTGRHVPLILLLHFDTLMADALGEILAAYRREGVTFVPFTHAARDRAYRDRTPRPGPEPAFYFSSLARVKGIKLELPARPVVVVPELPRVCEGKHGKQRTED